MKQLLLGGGLGLMLGLALQLCGLADGRAVRSALAWRRGRMARALIFALGLAAAVTAFLMWLAVIDTDDIPVAAISGSLLAGGVLCGAGLGLAGGGVENALAGIGGGPALESLCMALGCAAGVALFPCLAPVRAWLDGLFLAVDGTLFRVTLHRPFLLGGGFLGQGCLGAALMVLALCIRKEPLAVPAPEAAAPEEPPTSIEPTDVRGETFVASLPGEEPVVVDTEPAADAPAESPAHDASEESAAETGGPAASAEAPHTTDTLVDSPAHDASEESAAETDGPAAIAETGDPPSEAPPQADGPSPEKEDALMDSPQTKDTPPEEPIFAADEALVPAEHTDAAGAPPGNPMDVTPGTDVPPLEQAAEALQSLSPLQEAAMPPEAILPPDMRKKGGKGQGKGKKQKEPKA